MEYHKPPPQEPDAPTVTESPAKLVDYASEEDEEMGGTGGEARPPQPFDSAAAEDASPKEDQMEPGVPNLGTIDVKAVKQKQV